MELIQAAFPNDKTCRMVRVQVDQNDFDEYSNNSLWRDGLEKIANWPRYETFKNEGLIVSPQDFTDHMNSYWSESTFNLMEGRKVVLDLILYLGEARSTPNAADLSAFKAISTTIIRQEIYSLYRLKQVELAYISFFHVFDAREVGVMNFHSHNLLFIT